MSITTSIILDQRRIKKNGKFPLKLRVISARIVRDYSTVFELKEADYKKLNAPRVSDEIQHIKQKSQQIISGANLVIEKLVVFDFFKFEEEYINTNDKLFKIKKIKPVVYGTNNPKEHFDYTPFVKRFTIFEEDHSRPKSISITFLSYIRKLLQQGRIGSAINYQRTYRSIKAFNGNVLFLRLQSAFSFSMKTG